MEWISVKYRLPIELNDMGAFNYLTTTVIIFDGISVHPQEYKAGNSVNFWGKFETYPNNRIPTHWMPLPQPPKQP
jgi:hypothetical protein